MPRAVGPSLVGTGSAPKWRGAPAPALRRGLRGSYGHPIRVIGLREGTAQRCGRPREVPPVRSKFVDFPDLWKPRSRLSLGGAPENLCLRLVASAGRRLVCEGKEFFERLGRPAAMVRPPQRHHGNRKGCVAGVRRGRVASRLGGPFSSVARAFLFGGRLSGSAAGGGIFFYIRLRLYLRLS